MNSKLQYAYGKYKSELSSKTRVIEVPSIPADESGTPIKVYIRPANLKLMKQIEQFEGNDLDTMIEAILLRSEDETGEKLFDGDEGREFIEELLSFDEIKELTEKIMEDITDVDAEEAINEAKKI